MCVHPGCDSHLFLSYTKNQHEKSCINRYKNTQEHVHIGNHPS